MPEPDDLPSRLEHISTLWTMVFRAHGDGSIIAQPARAELMHRYRNAANSYLLAIVRDPDLAEDLSQQFALKFLEGEFHKADPQHGRFRDYVKTTLVNLVRRHYRDAGHAPGPLPEGLGEAAAPEFDDADRQFVQQWREDVLEHTWSVLHEERPVFHDILRLRIEEPDLTSSQLAERYTAQFSRPMSAANVRKTLERAHAKFADVLVHVVAASLESPDQVHLRAELKELDLLKYCRSAVEAWSPPK